MKEPKVNGRRAEGVPRGGKALARLHQFEIQHGLPPTEVEKTAPVEPPPPADQEQCQGSVARRSKRMGRNGPL